MNENFELIFEHLVGHEGGYGNDPDDRGGPSKFGVTIAVLRAYRKAPNLTARDVANLRITEAKAIFRARYWDLCKADELPSGLDYAVVDYAYNSGVDRASRALQRLLKVSVDGTVGVMTVKACIDLQRGDELPRFINAYQDARLAFLKTTYGWWKYRNGWTTRVKNVRKVALTLAAGAADTPPPAPAPAPPAQPVALSPQKTANEVTGIGTIGTIATDTAQKIAPHINVLSVAKYLFLGLTVLGMLAAMYLAYQKMTKESG